MQLTRVLTMRTMKRIFTPAGDVYLLTDQNRGGTPAFQPLTHSEEVEGALGVATAKALDQRIGSGCIGKIVGALSDSGYSIVRKPKIMPSRDIYLLNMMLLELDAQSAFFDTSKYTYRYFNPLGGIISAVVLFDVDNKKMATLVPDEGNAGSGLLVTIGSVDDFDARHLPLPNSRSIQAFYLGNKDDLVRGAMELANALDDS